MEVKVIQVSTPPGREKEFVVIVPDEYSNNAHNIHAVAMAMGITKSATWTIIRKSDIITLDI